MSQKASRVQLRNNCVEPMEIRLEPWGEVYELAPSDTIDVDATGSSEGTLRFEVSEKSVIIHGWSGSVVRLRRNGSELKG